MSSNNTKKSIEIGLYSRIRQVRKKVGKTQQEFADLAGVHVVAWGEYERGNVVPRITVLAFLLDFGVSLNWLLTGENAAPLPVLTKDEELIATQRQALALSTDRIATLNHELEDLRKEMGRGKN